MASNSAFSMVTFFQYLQIFKYVLNGGLEITVFSGFIGSRVKLIYKIT